VGEEVRSCVFATGGGRAWRVLGATMSSVSAVRRRAGEAAGTVASGYWESRVSCATSAGERKTRQHGLADHEPDERRSSDPASDNRSLFHSSYLIK